MNLSTSLRQSWADKTKALGMLLVIIGHSQFVNEPLFIFIYPLFFLISGYFGRVKEGETFGAFVNKNARQLLVPYMVFYLLTMPFGMFSLWSHPDYHPHDMESWKWFIIRPMLGFSVKTSDISFCTNTPLWFLMALFLIRLFNTYSPTLKGKGRKKESTAD